MQCVLPNTILKKCPSEHDAMCPSKLDAMCPSEHEAVICSSHTLPTSFETYPYPKGEHNGAVSPKYASVLNMSYVPICIFIEKNIFLASPPFFAKNCSIEIKKFLPDDAM